MNSKLIVRHRELTEDELFAQVICTISFSVFIANSLMSLHCQDVRLTQLEPTFPEDDAEGEAGSERSESGEADENTSTPTSPMEEENRSDEQKDGIDKESEDDNEFEQAFGSGEDDDSD